MEKAMSLLQFVLDLVWVQPKTTRHPIEALIRVRDARLQRSADALKLRV
jgi:hypothetical protein